MSSTTRDNVALPFSQADLLAMIMRIQSMYIQDATPQQLFGDMLERLLEFTNSEYGFIGECLEDADGNPFVRSYAITDIAWNEMSRNVYQGFLRDGHIDFVNLYSLFGVTLRTGEPVISNEPATDKRRGGTPGGHPPLKSYMGLPFYLGGRMVGMIGLANHPQGFDQSMAEALGPLLQTCAQVIEGYRTERARKDALAQLTESREELARSSTELSAILTLSPDGFVAFDGNDSMMFANPSFRTMFGLSDTEMMDQAEFFRWIAGLQDGNHVTELPDDQQHNVQISLHRPRPATVSCQFRRLIDPQGRSFGAAYYFRDITHESEVDRMKTDFLSTAAHELRTPLASIHGFVDLLLNREFDAETRADLLSTIHRQSTSLVSMINELLDLARIEARAGKDFNIIPGDLRLLVAQTAETVAPTLDDSHRLETELPDTEIGLSFDADKLGQALLNVVSNAIKYSPDGGKIRISCIREDGRAGLRVEDEGMGMNEDQLARVFERFYRGDLSGAIPGTGLGMSLVKEIVDIHGGRIDVHSRPQQGTCVTIWLDAN